MQCKNPYIAPGGNAFGCGQCIPCRVNKRRTWTHRIMLEAAQNEANSFVTLTYDDDHIPHGNELRPKDLSLFLKRLRRNLHPLKIRYFGVGEYGDQTQRPHYHLALFGYPPCDRGITSTRRNGYCCPTCERVQRDWAMGNVCSGSLETASAAYIAGYVTKKLTNPGDERLDGRHPEFARMSNRPGIGAGFASEVASTLLNHRLDSPENIPSGLSHGKSMFPVGRYLRDKIRAEIGLTREELREYTHALAEQKMHPLREAATALAPPGSKMFAYKQALIDAAQGKIIQIENKQRKQKGSI